VSARQAVLELKGLSRSFGGLRAVQGVNISIFPGDRKAIIGPTMSVKIASTSFFSVGMNGPKSIVPSGGQIFWTILPPQASKAFWNPPTTSCPKA